MHGKSARSTARIAAAASSTELVASWKRTIPGANPLDEPRARLSRRLHSASMLISLF